MSAAAVEHPTTIKQRRCLQRDAFEAFELSMRRIGRTHFYINRDLCRGCLPSSENIPSYINRTL